MPKINAGSGVLQAASAGHALSSVFEKFNALLLADSLMPD
jgi:hypothetical protein